jgi:hypothetical protein
MKLIRKVLDSSEITPKENVWHGMDKNPYFGFGLAKDPLCLQLYVDVKP